MEQQQTPTPTATTTTTTSATATTTTSLPTEPPPRPPQPPPQQQQQQQQQQQTSSLPPPSSTTSTPSTPIPSSPNPNPNPNPTTQKSTPQQLQPQNPQSLPNPSQPRPPTFSRTWQQQPSFPHFSSPLSSLPSPSSSAPSVPSPSSSTLPSVSVSPPQRGGIAVGVPASHPSPSSQPAPFSASFGQQFGGLGRGGVNVPESVSTSNASQGRQTIQGMQGIGMMGSLASSSQMRPGGISAHHQQRPVQPSLRPASSPSSQSPATQNFQGHGLLRVSSAGSPSSPAPNTSQSMQSHNQPWLSSGSQGKPPLPPPSYRPQMNSPSLQQRSHISQQHHPLPTASQQQHMPSAQPQQPLPSHQPQEHYGQQFAPSRVPQSLTHQQQITRVQGSANQKPSSLAMVQPNTVQPGTQSRLTSSESDESGNRILSKRSINELVNQIDPSERLDPEVEDVLLDIAEDFVESITTFGCSLAKHRKSDTLEAKDILLHLERNWNMTLPGFGGDEIKSFKKPLTNDIHKERLAVIKKSILVTEVANTKNSVGQTAINAKGNLGKAHANVLGSPNFKIREVS